MGGTTGGFNELLNCREDHTYQAAVPKRPANTPQKGQEFMMANKDRRAHDMLPEFDFLSVFLALFFGSRLELKPIPIKVRQRR
jgi:hypothetical protein